MITKLSRIIADFFIRQKIVPDEHREIYEYGFELSISSVIGIILVLAIGLISGKFWESIVFYIVFCFTILFTGGFHAPNHLLCKLTFSSILLPQLALTIIQATRLRQRCPLGQPWTTFTLHHMLNMEKATDR